MRLLKCWPRRGNASPERILFAIRILEEIFEKKMPCCSQLLLPVSLSAFLLKNVLFMLLGARVPPIFGHVVTSIADFSSLASELQELEKCRYITCPTAVFFFVSRLFLAAEIHHVFHCAFTIIIFSI